MQSTIYFYILHEFEVLQPVDFDQTLGLGVQELLDVERPLHSSLVEVVVVGSIMVVDGSLEGDLVGRNVESECPVELGALVVHGAWNHQQVLVWRHQEGLVLPFCD